VEGGPYLGQAVVLRLFNSMNGRRTHAGILRLARQNGGVVWGAA